MTEPTYAQSFCSIAELDEDLNQLGSERENKAYQKVKAASDYLMKAIGYFVPVTRVLSTQQRNEGNRRLYIPPCLSISSIVNYGTTLAAADYVTRPDGAHWPNGPFSVLEISSAPVSLGSWSCLPNSIVIPGQWGLYNRSELTGTSLAAEQAADALTAQVADGSKVSPGMVLLIGTEQELVTATGSPTAGITTLGADLDASSEQLTLTSGAAVNVGEILRIGVEQMKVLDLNGNTAYVQRSWNKTRMTTHANAAAVDVYRTFSVTRAVNGTSPALHALSAAISRYHVPDDINFLCREIAGKMLKFSQSGFAGRTGDTNTGMVEYQFAIPRADVEQIATNYAIPRGGAG